MARKKPYGMVSKYDLMGELIRTEEESASSEGRSSEVTCFAQTVKVYVPHDCQGYRCDNERKVNLRRASLEMSDRLLDIFGGYTAYDTDGRWIDRDTQGKRTNLHEDMVTVFEMGHCMTKKEADALRKAIDDFVFEVGKEMYVTVQDGPTLGIFPRSSFKVRE